MSAKEALKEKPNNEYSNEEINELAEWLTELTLKQVFFLKESYEALLQMQAYEIGSPHVH